MQGPSGAHPSARRGRPTRTSRRTRSWPEVKPDLEELLRVELPPGLLGLGEPVDDAQSAARLLRETLQRGLLPIGATVAGEQLAVVLNVHRNTMSKAFQLLAEEGYLRRRRGRSPHVAAHRNVLPKRHTKRVSHTALAREYRFEMQSRIVLTERMRVAQLAAERRARVVERLDLDELDEVVVHSRIRVLREPDGVWVPAIAEIAYFAAMRASQLADALGEPGGVNSVHEFLRAKGIDPVTGAYEVRVGGLPTPFVEPWARMASLPRQEVKALPFLRFESTTHGHVGAIEFSVAYLHKDFFSLATTDVALEIKTGAVLEAARRLSGGVAADAELRPEDERPARPQTRRRAAR